MGTPSASASAGSGGAPPASASSGSALLVVSGASTLSPVPSTADSDGAGDDTTSDGAGDDTTVIHHSPERSFLDDFAPPGLSGSDLIASSTTVLNTTASVIHRTASAINTTASAVRQMFSSDTTRSHPSAGPARDARDPPPAQDQPLRDLDPAPPSREQFTKLQRQYTTLQRQMNEFVTGALIWYCPVTTTRTADTSIPMSRVLPHNH